MDGSGYRYCSFDRQRSHVARGPFVFLSNRDTQHNNQFAPWTFIRPTTIQKAIWDRTDVICYTRKVLT